MAKETFTLFKKSRELEIKIADFVANIRQAGVLFDLAMKEYLAKGVTKSFLSKREQVSLLEASNDTLRRTVESALYTNMILPDMRSDILMLLEGSDKIINKYESHLILTSVEKQEIPEAIVKPVLEIVRLGQECVSALMDGLNCFFTATTRTGDHVQYVLFLEHQIDALALEVKKAIFDNKRLGLARQLQLKDFIFDIEQISDMAEDVADALTVISAKHAV